MNLKLQFTVNLCVLIIFLVTFLTKTAIWHVPVGNAYVLWEQEPFVELLKTVTKPAHHQCTLNTY